MSDELLSVEVLDRGPDLVVSVSGELGDSSGLGAFVRLHKLAEDAGGKRCLARPRPQLESTIKLTMLHRLLDIRDDVPTAGNPA